MQTLTELKNKTLPRTMYHVMIVLTVFLSLSYHCLSLSEDGLTLLEAKNSLSDPTNSLSEWNPRDSTPCNWSHVTCNSLTHRVTSVDLSNSLLAGSFPLSLCKLPSLSFLSLLNNSINSSLPSDLSTCHNLNHLDLSQNLLVGPIPDTLSKLDHLKTLDLSANNFSGEIPASFSEFRLLERLSLVSNLLNGSFPEFIVKVKSLKELFVAYNPFKPSEIPSHIGDLSELEALWLADCNLVGSIPESLGRLARLKNLDLSINQLNGLIPSSLTELKSVVQIELYRNSLSGELPKGFSNLTMLRRFDVSTNWLTGSIPVELCELPLESLNLFENRLEGYLPESIARSPNLDELKLFDNDLSGSLPGDLGKNSPLRKFDVSNNRFSGEIPEGLCAKGVLEELLLIHNEFSGEIPARFGDCKSLWRVRVGNNKLSGTVPEDFWGLPRVFLMELTGNMLSGHISSKVSGARNLSNLLISNNRFSGNIPENIGSLKNLVAFSASNNSISGEIPGSLVRLSKLNKLDLSGNDLSGGIPVELEGLDNLNDLNLAHNRLSGEIPKELSGLPVLNYLDLSGNNLYGEIPIGLQNLRLNLLNLSYNQLSGDIPPMYAKDTYRNSFLGNPGLCGDLPDLCPPSGGNKSEVYLWVLVSIFILAGLVFIVGVVWFYLKYQKFRRDKKGIIMSKWKSFHRIGFDGFEIMECLNEDNVIGSGASGKVYKVVLSNGEVVAVKKLWGETRKGNASEQTDKGGFEAEVETLGRIRHKNIVRLWCCCNSGDSKLLVYEFMPNGSLGDMLHGRKGGLLDWPIRYKIALDAADGLSYLHHDCVPPIVHRDIKSNNILLDSEFGARVADFGVAKVFVGDRVVESMSAIAGSYGYIAPEYAYTLRVNEKSDIYSFGVVILELITGRRPVDPEFREKDLVKWVCSTLDQKGVDHVIDPKLGLASPDEISRVLEIGLLCVSALPINRPSMRKVVNMLKETRVANKDDTVTPFDDDDASDQGSLV